MLAPYLLVFAAFVVYPSATALAGLNRRIPTVALYNDPIFARTVVNTLIFLIIGINLKMLIALCSCPASSCSSGPGSAGCR
jgi:multiple sugar transport system permease protein